MPDAGDHVFTETPGAPIKSWTRGVPVEDQAWQQLRNVASLPFIHKHVAAMPDVHWGRGATIGSVIPTTGAIIPAAVGVDIGCGMTAVQTSLVARDLPDTLARLRSGIERKVPHGRTAGGAGATGERGGNPLISSRTLFDGRSDTVRLPRTWKRSWARSRNWPAPRGGP